MNFIRSMTISAEQINVIIGIKQTWKNVGLWHCTLLIGLRQRDVVKDILFAYDIRVLFYLYTSTVVWKEPTSNKSMEGD